MGESKRRKQNGTYPEPTEKQPKRRMTQKEIMELIGQHSFSMAAALALASDVKDLTKEG